MKANKLTLADNASLKKTLQLSALALAVAAGSAAMAADVTIYGRAHVSVDMLDDGDDYSELNMSSNSSRLGFKGSREFDGVTGIFQVEQEIDFSDSGSSWASRDTYVGVKGNFGMVRAGKFDTPFKKARGPANLFGDQLGEMRNFTRVGNGRFDERAPNTLHYQTPKLGSAKINLAYSLHEGNDAVDDDDQTAVSLSVTYNEGPVDLALAYEQFDEDRSRGERDAIRVAAGFDVTSALKLVAFFQTVDHDNDVHDADVFGVGGEYKLGSKNRIRAHYLDRSGDADDTDSQMIALGFEHRIDSALRVYVNYAIVDNDDNIALTPWSQARTTGTSGTAGEEATGLSLGMRFDF